MGLSHGYPVALSDSEAMPDGSPQPLTRRQALLVDIAERRRKDPNWRVGADPTYSGPDPSSLERMTDADFEVFQAQQDEWQRRLRPYLRPVEPQVVRQEDPTPQPRPRPPVRAALPVGQRIRELRRALGWTQRQVAAQIGVSSRSIIRYEQGQSSPIQVAPLLALRRLEATIPRTKA